MTFNRRWTRSILLGATALTGALTLSATQASAQERRYDFDVPAQPLNAALQTFARQAQVQVIFAEAETKSLSAPSLSGSYSADEALQVLLAGTQLKASRNSKGVLQVAVNADPQSGSAAGGGAEVEALIVTAQKREEDIQDVPIAISAFTQEDLTRSQVAGGPDLMTQVPNMTFTKTNFSGYSIQIRGIGTQAISATTDPAVAVAFNNTPFIRNRFFEQEFYDLQRIEVLRGPQGTLYGRNATAGVVNVISAKPSFRFEAKASADVANFSSIRLEGMVNIPLVEDVAALRLAGAWTKRDGYAMNEVTGSPIDGRDLWSSRLSLRVQPTDGISANLIWEHFEEDDDRLRSGKQLCKKHSPTHIAGFAIPPSSQPGYAGTAEGTYSLGCEAVSLYAPEAFQTPNGFSLPYYQPLGQLTLPVPAGFDPYQSATQSRDLRVIESSVNPRYQAETDVVELQMEFDIGSGLTLTSETAYGGDTVWSTQDFNRFTTAPGAFDISRIPGLRPGVLSPEGVFCDPQIGCTDRLALVDLSTAKSQHFSQEFRLGSDYDGPLNFSLGANFLRYDTEDKYYVFVNTLSMWAALMPSESDQSTYIPNTSDNSECLVRGRTDQSSAGVYSIYQCLYMDPNPLESLNDQGHNYFLSRNPFKLISYAAFGEAYYEIAPDLKVTAGLRWTVDSKQAPRIPSWLLASESVGYPVAEVYERTWREPTGRLTVDWTPQLDFTDETLVYASYAHGYKAGGSNPPLPVIAVFAADGEALREQSLLHPTTFEAEFIDAFELGTKNTLLEGRLTVNGSLFYYDYEGYQISQIVDRSALNSNFDAEVWGAELEADWRPAENLRLGLKLGYESTRIGDGMRAIDPMDRTAGDPNWIAIRPFPTVPSNCIMPVWLITWNDQVKFSTGAGGTANGPCVDAYARRFDPVTAQPYTPDPDVSGLAEDWTGYPGFDPQTAPNNGEGIAKELAGNELPNAPHLTTTLTADYTLPLPNEWLVTLHTDLYYQSEAWTRVFNTEGYDKLKAYTNVNFAAIFTNEDAGWKVMAYVKNVFDRDSITGAFLNSDDTGLTTNVFLTEPRLYGVRVTKDWTGGSTLGRLGQRRESPYPFTFELGGGPLRQEAESEAFAPAFAGSFTPELDILGSQNGELDWGDAREVKLTYRPAGNWNVSLGARFGKSNVADKVADQAPSIGGCAGPQALCDMDPKYFLPGINNYANAETVSREEHTIVDFAIGRDVDFGILGQGKSSLSAGLRYARLDARTATQLQGVPDWRLAPVNAFFDFSQHTQYDASLTAERDFEGVGPAFAWDASKRLIGNETSGGLDLAWSITGGVLFGKQRTVVEAEADGEYFRVRYQQWTGSPRRTPNSIITEPAVASARSEDVTVPTLGVALGLSYEIDRLNVSTGYRWERYLDAIDGGLGERQQFDRDFHGPYFKIAVGFGR